MAPDDVARLFLAALPLLLSNEGALDALGEAQLPLSSASPSEKHAAEDAALQASYPALAAALRAACARGAPARARARLARVCVEARCAAAATSAAATTTTADDAAARRTVAARLRAVHAIARALVERRMLPRAAPELLALIQLAE
jgi:hypothetical protein